MSEKLKIYRMNDYDWWSDYSEDKARQNYTEWQKETCGIPAEDIDVEDIYELSEANMDKMMYIDDDGTKLTFREELENNTTVGFFASTES